MQRAKNFFFSPLHALDYSVYRNAAHHDILYVVYESRWAVYI